MVELLRTTDSTISVIAASVGWGDPDFAARQFRRSVGLSPSEYRRITVNAPKGTAPD
jgi:transcriptional regulator GlxA family with amidase domain